MNTVKVTISGTTPLLMNRPPAYIVDETDTNVKVNNPNINKDEKLIRT